jgi:hypothetical protein
MSGDLGSAPHQDGLCEPAINNEFSATPGSCPLRQAPIISGSRHHDSPRCGRRSSRRARTSAVDLPLDALEMALWSLRISPAISSPRSGEASRSTGLRETTCAPSSVRSSNGLLAKYDYPPDAEAEAIELVVRQMETFADEWTTRP